MKSLNELLCRLNFPTYPLKITRIENELYVYDALRHKKLKLTPEEWVRQHTIQYLLNEKGYPPGLVSLEKGIKVNQTQKRYDALVYDKRGKPLVLVECKAPEVAISQLTFEQALVYNRTLQASHILITNGLNHFCCAVNVDGSYTFLQQIPSFQEIDSV